MKSLLHILALVLALALMLPSLAGGMTLHAPEQGECPGHAAEHPPAGQMLDQISSQESAPDSDCSRNCVLACALAGLTAGMPAASVFPSPRPEHFLVSPAGPWQLIDNGFELFRPPRPSIA